MSKSKIVFISQNNYKFEELELLFKGINLEIHYLNHKIQELQSDNLDEIIKHKTLMAYQHVGHPVFVDHTGLFISAWSGMPAGLTQLFWEKLQGERICEMLSPFSNRHAIARTVIGFCDGKRLLIKDFEGILEGTIADKPRGARKFQWGTIFVPSGKSQTYSELTVEEVNMISHRAIAFKNFIHYLDRNPLL